jgi:hypothetical protein
MEGPIKTESGKVMLADRHRSRPSPIHCYVAEAAHALDTHGD